MTQTAKSGYCRSTTRNRWNLSPGFLVTLLVLLAPLSGCEDRNEGLIDPHGSPPFIRSFSITPDSISLNTLTPTNGQYPITLSCQAEVSDPDGPLTIRNVIADVIPPGGGDPLLSVVLPADRVTTLIPTFSGSIGFSVAKTDIGQYRVVVRATDELGLSGNTIDRRLLIWRTNTPPVLSGLVAPDTVIVPPLPDSLLIPMTVAVFDSNGLGDIREVYFRSLDSSDPTRKFLLQDNGDLKNYGDQVAGDGIYSIVVKLQDSPTVRKTYRFAFQALDSFADTSATLLHSITVR